MHCPATARIHPTAVISPETVLGEHVEIGAYAVLEGEITLGDYCVVRPGAYLYGPLTMGRGNTVHSGAVLGDLPQHLRFGGQRTTVEIGDANVFREGVTVHRGTTDAFKTVIGNHNYFMVNSHVAHDCVVANRCMLTNGALLGGHVHLADSVIISGNSCVHQRARLGRLAMLCGNSGTTKDVPPFIMQQNLDNVVGINVIGMKRAGMTREQTDAVKEAFRILYREGLILPAAIARLGQDLGQVDAVQEMIAFLHGVTKGISPMRGRLLEAA